jgi:putative nucleotidyltransferase with HDIG domain
MYWKPDHPAFQRLLHTLLEKIPTVYVVGGVVRDHLLGSRHKVTDLDLMIDDAVLPVARAVADQLGWAFYPLDEARDVARLVFTANVGAPLVCDIARVRGGSIEGDLLMRDFTINAMSFQIERVGEATLIDLCGGQADLAARIIRRVSAASLADDPVRLLRAIRFMVQFDFALDEQTRLQIKRICSTVTLTSAERIRDELWKMLNTNAPDQALEALRSVGLLIHVLPEVARMEGVAQSYPHFEDVYRHTLRVMQNTVAFRNWILDQQGDQPGAMAHWCEALSRHHVALRHHLREPLAGGRTRAEWLVWHAMFHDIGKPTTRTEEIQPNQSIRYRFFDHERIGAAMAENRLTALRFSRPEIALAQRVITFHMRPHLLSSSFLGQTISKRSKFRFFRDTFPGQSTSPSTGGDETQSDGIDVLCLAIADYEAIHRHAISREDGYLEHSKELFAYALDSDGFKAARQPGLIDGHTLMQRLNLPPGRQVGQLLTMLQEAQAAGEIETAEAALTLATTWLQETRAPKTEHS